MDQLKIDKIWYKITNNSQSEYILGSQLIDFIKEMNKLSDFVAITPEQMDSVNNFSLSNPDIKIYKYTIGEFLNNLIGLKFDRPLDTLSDEKQKNGLNTKVNEHSVLDDTIIDNIKNQNKIGENQKDDKKIEDNLHEEIEYYKNKYDVLKEEFEFYKKRQILNQKIPKRELNVDFEYTIDQFKRQIEEQRKIMLNISQNIKNRTNDSICNSYIKESKGTNGKIDQNKSVTETGRGINTIRNLRQFGQILFIFLVILTFSLMLSKLVFTSTNDIWQNDFKSYKSEMDMVDTSFHVDPWWTKFDKLSHLIYKFQDWYNDKNYGNIDNTQFPDSDMNTVYDEVFGIKNRS